MLKAAGNLIATSGPSLSTSAAAEAVALAALKVATLSAHGGRIELADLYGMLKSEASNCGDATVGIGLNDQVH